MISTLRKIYFAVIMASKSKRRRTIRATASSMVQYIRDRASTSSSNSMGQVEISPNISDDSMTAGPSTGPAKHRSIAIHTDSDDNISLHDGEYIRSSSSEVASDTESEDELVTHNLEDEIWEPTLRDLLQRWAVSKGVTHAALRGLLRILHTYFPELPLDPRSLLKTGTVEGIVAMDGGFYFHFGVTDALKKWVAQTNYTGADIPLQFNIDGLPVFKSTKLQLWPILGMVKVRGIKTKPFVIGIFLGRKKPPIDGFLVDFVADMKNLMDNGVTVNEVNFRVSILSFICDTPARCFIKQSKLYSGYHGCDKCTQEGTYDGRMTFPEIGCRARTNESFRQREFAAHHIGNSPLESLDVDMVTSFPLDYMHLVLLGCMRKLLTLWTKGPLKNRLDGRTLQRISLFLVDLRDCVTSDFARQPRSIDELEFWKATEFRSFLLYLGYVVLKDELKSSVYENFLMLTCAIRLLLTPTAANITNAQARLDSFVKGFAKIYGQHSMVYNVHCLTNLPAEVRMHGALENFSAFAYENYLGSIKELIRGSKHILQQVISRVREKNNVEVLPSGDEPFPILSKRHTDGPVPDGFSTSTQYHKAVLHNLTISTAQDKCVQIGATIGVVQNILERNDELFVVYRVFTKVGNLFKYPTHSTNVGISKVSVLHRKLYVANIESIQSKCVLLNYKISTGDQPDQRNRKYVAVSILHTVN